VIDAEVELAAVIGRVTQGVAPENALACIAGYMIINDVTNRSLQRASLQWFEAKSADTFCPAGPWLVTADEVPDPHNLSLQSCLNGEPLQTGQTKDMIFKLPELVSRLSSRITLMPGDVIATGTPAGIGSAQEPPRILKDGDTITLSIPGLGQQQNGIKQKKQG
jgi:2-keto-4-pentenoate hydratase/2-oxohepta-3-ene-1,7-dioic acid hydratase in catechol pathway